MRNLLVGIRNVLLWSYDRGSWQYDLLCLLIVAAIFLLPGRYFGDRDRENSRSESLTNGKAGLASKQEQPFEIVIGAGELREVTQSGTGRIDLTSSFADTILAVVEKRCKCKALLVLPYEMTRDDTGKLAYRVWYRKRSRL